MTVRRYRHTARTVLTTRFWLRPWSRRRVAAVAVAFTLLTSLASVSTADAHVPHPATETLERQFVDLVNAERVRSGLGPLVANQAATRAARAWSSVLAADGRLHHVPPDRHRQELAAVTPAWTAGGENIGRGGAVLAIHRAFMDSPSHARNVLGGFNTVGVGVVVDGPTIWVTVRLAANPHLRAQRHADVVAAEARVARLFRAAFGRDPDPDGLMTWTYRHASGEPLHVIAGAFAGSAEYRARHGVVDNRAYVANLYHNVLGRAPDPGGFAHWTRLLDTGALGRGATMVGFSESAEAKLRFPDRHRLAGSEVEAQIRRLYRAVLGREPDPGGAVTYADVWLAGWTMERIASDIARSPESRARSGATNEAFVYHLYRTVLGREPDPDGFAHWTGLLNSGAVSRGGVVLGFSDSVEFRARVG